MRTQSLSQSGLLHWPGREFLLRLRGFASAAQSAVIAWMAGRLLKAAAIELKYLSDRQLRDIGIERDEITASLAYLQDVRTRILSNLRV